jgi:hypothetical protein
MLDSSIRVRVAVAMLRLSIRSAHRDRSIGHRASFDPDPRDGWR